MATITEQLADLALEPCGGVDLTPARRMELYALDTLAVTLAGTVAQLQHEVEGKAAALPDECGFGDRVEPLRRAVAGLAATRDVHGLASVLGAKSPLRAAQAG